MTVPWLIAGSVSSIPGLADAGGLFLSVVSLSWMIGWVGDKVLWSLVGSSPALTGEDLGGVFAFSGEVLSLERSRLGWEWEVQKYLYHSLQHDSHFLLFYMLYTHTLLGIRGRCPSGPLALCFSSRFLSLWSSPSVFPASSGTTEAQTKPSLQWSTKAFSAVSD